VRYRVSFAQGLGLELEAAEYGISPDGELSFWAQVDEPVELKGPVAVELMQAHQHRFRLDIIVTYARGVWRSVAAVGAFTEATKPLPKETPGENPRRR
jgi:hypothetical protein